MDAAPHHVFQSALDGLVSLASRLASMRGAAPTEEADAAPGTPSTVLPAETPADDPPADRPGPPAEPPSLGSISERPAPPPTTPEPVQRYQAALADYRSLADEFESITGQKYSGLQDFDRYAKRSSNWMAWRYMELCRQYLEAGKLDAAASVFDKAERQFPDDPLIHDRMERSR